MAGGGCSGGPISLAPDDETDAEELRAVVLGPTQDIKLTTDYSLKCLEAEESAAE